MRRTLIALLAAACTCFYSVEAFALQQFNTEAEAAKHCPQDTVVWLNLPTMIWHYKGQRWYGNTKHGAYVCEKEASAEGGRATKNGE